MAVPRQGRRERSYLEGTGATEDAASGRAARPGGTVGIPSSPPTRALLWEGCCNIRDLGGLPTDDGGETRSGIDIDTVARDYAESEANWAPSVGRWLEEAPDDVERRKRRFLAVMAAPTMHGVLTELERRHGTVRDYLVGSGADADKLEQLRDRLRG